MTDIQTSMIDEHVEPTAALTWRALRKMVVLTLLVVCVLNALCWFWLQYYNANGGYRDIRQKWTLLKSLSGPVDVIALGDSSCNHGVMPERMNAQLGIKSLNLCTIGNMMMQENAWMLDTYFSQTQQLSSVLLVHVYDIWHRVPMASLVAQVPLPWGYWNQLEPPWTPSADEWWDIVLTKYVPIYSTNKSLATMVKFGWNVPPYRLSTNGGFDDSALPDPQRVLRDTADHIAAIGVAPEFVVSPENHEALLAILRLAAANQVNVYYVHSPVHRDLYNHQGIQKRFADINRYLTSLRADYPNFHLLFDEPMLFGELDMESADHVIPEYAEVYTDAIITRMMAIENGVSSGDL